MTSSAYKVNFLFAIGAKIIRIALVLVFYSAVAYQVPGIPFWDANALYVLGMSYFIIDYVSAALFQRNILFGLPGLIQMGEFDRILTYPVPKLLFTSIQRVDFMDLFSLLPFAGFWWYMVRYLELSPSPMHILLYLFFCVVGIVFTFAIALLFGSVSFWTVRSNGFALIVDQIVGISRFPVDLFPNSLRFIFIYLFPIAAASMLPTQALLGFLDVREAVGAIIATTVLLILALLLWRAGLRRYDSASS